MPPAPRKPALADQKYSGSASYLLDFFYNLSAQRQFGASGPMPIPWSETASLLALMGWESLSDMEIRCISILDGIWMDNYHKKINDKRK